MASPSTSQWHSVNPQTRPLTLTILELTPLALTLSLTLAPQSLLSQESRQNHHTPIQHMAHTHNHAHGPSKNRKKSRHRRPDSDDEATAVEVDEDANHHVSPSPGSYPSTTFLDSTNFKDLLSHGVVVSVNGQAWNRIVAHVSDPDDEGIDGDTEDHGDGEAGDWEYDAEAAEKTVRDAGIEEGLASGSNVTRRRPRKARFGISAGDAVRTGEEKTMARRNRRPSELGRGCKPDGDRAVVVVYGLSPGKEYEVELQVVGLSTPDGMDALVSNSVLIPPSPSPLSGGFGIPRSRANSLRSRSHPRSRSNSISAPSPGQVTNPASLSADASIVTSPGRVTPPTNETGEIHPHPQPIPTNILNPIDTQAAQIRHMIAAAHAEKEHVQTQIKEARRASQRAEAALRVEIDQVKKSTEKAGSVDLRAKQKALALQEQVKQGWAWAEHAEQEAALVENGMKELENQVELAKKQVETVNAEWKTTKAQEDEIRDSDKKVRNEEEKKLAEVAGKIDKLRAKKEKKEAERADLEKRIEELERQRKEAEKRNEEERLARRNSAYWWDPYVHGHGHGHAAGHGHPQDHGRTLSSHPSLNNISGNVSTGYTGPSFRPRGGFQPRYPSGGRPTPSQPSPVQASGFFPVQHPVPTSTSSPAFRPPKAVATSSPAATNGTPSSSGVNVAALPFHPSSTISQTPSYDASQHTTLMPPQLQHRIYLPNVRPHPAPNFNPPPSVLAEQAQRQSPKTSSAPSFPPLPTNQSASPASNHSSTLPGPSLASIVTRAVLSPTSALATQEIGQGETGQPSVSGPSPPPGAPRRGSGFGSAISSPISPTGPSHSTSPTPTRSSSQNINSNNNTHATTSTTNSSRSVTFSSPPERTGDFPPLSPTGPWLNFPNNPIGSNMVRNATPPLMNTWGQQSPGRESPASSGRGPTGSGGPNRKGTGDAS